MTFRTLAIVGVGLIGGSIALAARARGVAERIIGVGPGSSPLERACPPGMLDDWQVEIGAGLREADAVVVCTPVDEIACQIAACAVWARADALLTDVGSTKAVIVESLSRQLRPGTWFVGSHPLAGSEKSGVQFANGRLFENRVVVLTPHHHFHPDAVSRATMLWEALGARVKQMTARDHDRAMALTSHLPHLVAAALAALLPAELRELAASGFRDTTRVAGGDPRLWLPIFQHNEPALAQTLSEFCKLLEGCCRGGDSMHFDYLKTLLSDGKRNRDALGS